MHAHLTLVISETMSGTMECVLEPGNGASDVTEVNAMVCPE